MHTIDIFPSLSRINEERRHDVISFSLLKEPSHESIVIGIHRNILNAVNRFGYVFSTYIMNSFFNERLEENKFIRK